MKTDWPRALSGSSRIPVTAWLVSSVLIEVRDTNRNEI